MTGRVVAIRGRRVMVEDASGALRVCFLSGHRAVVGDEVVLDVVGDDEGKLCDVRPSVRALVRSDGKGRDQVLASHLGGLLVVAAVDEPRYRPGLIDRYLVAANAADLQAALVVTKTDLPADPEVEADLQAREAAGLTVVRACTPEGRGVAEVAALIAARSEDGPWAMVGHSGVGKTSLAAALLPGVDVGPVGTISAYWNAGRHTTTGSTIFRLPDGGELVDSPGIRTFLPGGLSPATVRDHFPGLPALACRYRDCLHRPGEDGCRAEAEVAPEVLVRYRRLLDEVIDVHARSRP